MSLSNQIDNKPEFLINDPEFADWDKSRMTEHQYKMVLMVDDWIGIAAAAPIVTRELKRIMEGSK